LLRKALKCPRKCCVNENEFFPCTAPRGFLSPRLYVN